MKCQRCNHPATFHITELTDGVAQELHLCQEHAAEYLVQAEDSSGASEPSSFGGALAQHLQVSQTGEELARLDENACPICGITFYEFRQVGRLGCPHDYIAFEQELEPLLISVHGEVQHKGKHPQTHAGGTDARTELIRLRRQLKEAVEREDYEEASRLRDRVRDMEQGVTGSAERDEDSA